MNFTLIFFWLVTSIFIFSTLEKVTEKNFSSTFFSSTIASIFLLVIQSIATGIMLFAVSGHSSAIVNIGIVCAALVLSLIAPYLTFLFGDKFLPKFQVVNHRFLIRCSFVFLAYELIAILLTSSFSFLGVVIFYLIMRKVRIFSDNNWLYSEWFYDRYFYH
jgi:hypothetical protein